MAAFDAYRDLTMSDVIFTPKFLKIIIQWSKTLQTRVNVQVISLSRLKGSTICPQKALKEAINIYTQNTERIERIRRAHVQKHSTDKQNWARDSEPQKKPWFCKFYQTGMCSQTKDHELLGKDSQVYLYVLCRSGQDYAPS